MEAHYEIMPMGEFFVPGRNGYHSRSFATARLAELYWQQMHDSAVREWAGNPVLLRDWGNLYILVLRGSPVKQEAHKQLMIEAQRYMEEMASLQRAADDWKEAVEGEIDDAPARKYLFDMLRHIEKRRGSQWTVGEGQS